VYSIKIGRYSVNLLGFEDGDLVTNSEGVTECQKGCSNGTCACTGKNRVSVENNWLKKYLKETISFELLLLLLQCLGNSCYDDMACSSEPCSFGSTCESLPGGRYACFCLPGLTGANCDKCKYFYYIYFT